MSMWKMKVVQGTRRHKHVEEVDCVDKNTLQSQGF